MTIVNMLDAKTHLSRLVEAVESGAEKEIVIARNGRPVARLVPVARAKAGPRIGIAKGRFKAPEPDAALDAAAAALLRKSK
ncbi:MAG: type II toxin-antitoxin system prevent-host-death family antitoxin [Hydrogenophilaceae bacterium]|jgi:prevent-host-death family protein|nr:type II toxin-antitoxin system prevent-host-death family antitoxin [Hydrogenophilaceae bacterium]